MTVSAKFRESFKISKEKINWYPGHMNHSFKHMQAVMRKVDCVLEVHDSRIPFSGRNPRFIRGLIGSKPHILVLNKRDLIDKSSYSVIKEKCLEEYCQHVVFTNCLNKACSGLHGVIPLAVKLIKGEQLIPRLDSTLKMMVVGVPNVGKSSVINALRHIVFAKGRATAVGPVAGVTRAVQTEIKVHSDPPVYLIDTPGILQPNIDNVETGMKLALCSCLNDSLVGVMNMADFLLYWMNKTRNFIYLDHFLLKEPVDDILPLLVKIAMDKNLRKRVKSVETNRLEIIPDLHSAALHMVTLFRRGTLGDLDLDKNYSGNFDEFRATSLPTNRKQ